MFGPFCDVVRCVLAGLTIISLRKRESWLFCILSVGLSLCMCVFINFVCVLE